MSIFCLSATNPLPKTVFSKGCLWRGLRKDTAWFVSSYSKKSKYLFWNRSAHGPELEEKETTCSAAAVELRDGHLQFLSTGSQESQIPMKKDYPRQWDEAAHSMSGEGREVIGSLGFFGFLLTAQELNHKSSLEQGVDTNHTLLPAQQNLH